MTNVMEMLGYLSYAELNSVAKELASIKREAKEREKAGLEEARAKVTKLVNELIQDQAIVKGTEVVVLYRGKEVVATVNTVPSESARNLNLASDYFDTKDGSRYTEKYNFIRVA